MAAKKLISMRLNEKADNLLTELAESDGVTESEILAEAIRDLYAKRQEEKRLSELDTLARATFAKYAPIGIPGAGKYLWLWMHVLRNEIDNFEPSREDLVDELEALTGEIEPFYTESDPIEGATEGTLFFTDSQLQTMTKAVRDMMQEYINALFENMIPS